MYGIKKVLRRALQITLISAAILQLSACAVSKDPNSNDPHEAFNRRVFAFNNIVDSLALRPAAEVYTHVVPPFAQKGVHNFFNNLDEITDVSNDLLQGRGTFAFNDSMRFIINSTWGIGGTIDVARGFTLPPHNEDFGLTLAAWGATHSDYSVIPILGPSTYRDSVGSAFDLLIFSAWPYFIPRNVYYPLLATWAIDKRAQLLPADQLIQQSFDPYIFIRNAFMTMRAQQVADNKLSFQEYRRRFLEHRENSNSTKANETLGTEEKPSTDNNSSGVIVVG